MRSIALAVAAAFLVTLAGAGDAFAGDRGTVMFDNNPDALSMELPRAPEPFEGPMAKAGAAAGGLWGLSSTYPGIVFRVDKNTGLASYVVACNGAASFTGLAWLDDELYGSDLIYYPGYHYYYDVGRIDHTTGVITYVSDQDGSYNWHGLAASQSEGCLYSIDYNDSFRLKRLFPTGVVVDIGSGTGIDGRGMAYDDGTNTLYATGWNSSGSVRLYRVNTSTGTATYIGNMGINSYYTGLSWDEDGDALYLTATPYGSGPSTLYRVNTSTAALTLVGATGFNTIDGLGFGGPPPPGGGADCDLTEIEAKLDDEFRFTDDDELREWRDEINAQLAALEAKADEMTTSYCDIVRLLHTPSGIRTADCGGQHYEWNDDGTLHD